MQAEVLDEEAATYGHWFVLEFISPFQLCCTSPLLGLGSAYFSLLVELDRVCPNCPQVFLMMDRP